MIVQPLAFLVTLTERECPSGPVELELDDALEPEPVTVELAEELL
ncbi:hypothetical protein [Novosphingobium sp. G106]|nr:hypothetical protein [Novosphingobium sp. G106]